MAKLASTDLALVTARVGCLRLGASRLGFYPHDVKGPGADYPCEYMWREVKPPTTQWTLVHEGVVCGKRPVAAFSMVVDVEGLPTASFTWEPVEGGLEGEAFVNFTDTTTGGAAPYTYAWDFGDGVGTSTDQSPQYVFTGGIGQQQTFTVTLTVTDNNGGVDSYSTDVTVIFN